MIGVLTVLKNEFDSMNIPYTFDEWDREIELPQFIGEISEVPTTDEDGKNEYSFILTGYATSYSELFTFAEQLRNKYKIPYIVDKVVIKYDNMTTIDNGTEDLKQIQVNLTIKDWRM